jgi:hypothetical protein
VTIEHASLVAGEKCLEDLAEEVYRGMAQHPLQSIATDRLPFSVRGHLRSIRIAPGRFGVLAI